jgi:hypothetical protein
MDFGGGEDGDRRRLRLSCVSEQNKAGRDSTPLTEDNARDVNTGRHGGALFV